MRARIAQLLSERESRKRVSGSGSVGGTRRGTGGARPSSSRAHSVRRTSLRERGLTAKHDAHEEARLRNTFVTNVSHIDLFVDVFNLIKIYWHLNTQSFKKNELII